MRKDLLLKVVDELKKPMPKTLDLNMQFFLREEKDNKKKNCGCIIGMLLTKAWFKKLGLKIVTGKLTPPWQHYISDDGNGSYRCNSIVYKKEYEFNALKRLFEINSDEALFMFGPKNKNSRPDAIKRIKLVTSGKWKKQNEPGPPVTQVTT